MRDMSHQNINSIIGACLDDPQNLFFVLRFCSRGSLRDLIKNSAANAEMHLDFTFKLAFMADITNVSNK
jgi:serine/threonine protein kinase